MKLLFCQWKSFMNRGIEKALKMLEIPYEVFFYNFQDWEKDEHFVFLLENLLEKGEYLLMLSVNFSPLISFVCEQKEISYVAWVYDSPIHIRNQEALKNKNTHVYFFDRGQAEEYQKKGIAVHYMPLAVDETDFLYERSTEKIKPYRADISMVGKLYQTRYADYSAPLNDYLKGYLEGLICAQMKVYGGYFLSELMTEELLQNINKDYKELLTNDVQIDRRELEYMLACEITGRERYMALALLSNHYKVAVYSTEQEKKLTKVSYRGYVDYYTQMPIVFQVSKVNLNISLKTIRTGIPLRILDIMGCEGFVISNFQSELAEYFKLGEECIIYENLEDLFDKVRYYLAHEEERKKIAHNGLERIRRDFTYQDRIKRMLKEYLTDLK